MEMTKTKWSKNMEDRCLAILGTGAAKAAKKTTPGADKTPGKPIEPVEQVEPAAMIPPEPAAAKPAGKDTKEKAANYPATFNFDAPEDWDDFRIAVNISSL